MSYTPATSLMLVSVQCKTAGHGPLSILGRGWEHSLDKITKLQCKTAGHVPCLFQQGALRITVIFGPRTVFSAQITFTTLITEPISYQTGKESILPFLVLYSMVTMAPTNLLFFIRLRTPWQLHICLFCTLYSTRNHGNKNYFCMPLIL